MVRQSLFSNKRGQEVFGDVFYVIAFLFFAGILFFITYFVWSQIKTPMADTLQASIPDGNTTFNVVEMGDKTLGGVGLFNNLYPLIIVGLLIMVMVSASMSNSHPVFFFICLLLLGVALILGTVFSNVFQQITSDSNFGDTASHFTITSVFMKYLPIIVAIVVIVAMIIMFSKTGGSSGGGL